MQNLTQLEFIYRIDMLKRTLTEAWNANQKVKALKIAIQASNNYRKQLLLTAYSPFNCVTFYFIDFACCCRMYYSNQI